MKKFFAILVAVMMIMALIATPTFAANNGIITIKSPINGSTYSIYKLLDLEITEDNAFFYHIDSSSEWYGFFTNTPDYVSVNAHGYVIWTNASDDEATAAEFADLALAYATANNITPVAAATCENGEDVIFDGLALGYYLVDSAVGVLCGLNSTQPTVEISEKNGAPTLEKYVFEDSTFDWEKSADAAIGQTVSFKIDIITQTGAEGYTLHDLMGVAFTMDDTSISITYNGNDVDASNYSLNTSNACGGCTFEIVFTQAFCDTLEKDGELVVSYNTVLNGDALPTDNPNTAWLTYGDGLSTAKKDVAVSTYSFDIVKTNNSGALLNGAIFELYNADGATKISLINNNDGTYRLALDTESGIETIEVNGKVTVYGLDSGKYFLKETEAPAGYNKLPSLIAVEIVDSNLYAVVEDNAYVSGGVQVINQIGTILPSTGGIGTTLFVTLGGLAVLAAGVVLFAKKRMSQIAE